MTPELKYSILSIPFAGFYDRSRGFETFTTVLFGVKMDTILWIGSFVVAVNLLGFIIMGIDKARAKKHSWRISEFTLFFIAIIGGSIGSIIGMYTFRHKTRHKYFTWGMPAILLLQIALILFLLYNPNFNISVM